MSTELILDERYTPFLKERLTLAHQYIYAFVFHAHVHPGKTTCPVTQIFDHLISSARSNVSVHLIFANNKLQPKLLDHNRRSMEYFRNSPVNIWSYEQPRLLHSKFFIIDNTYAIIGSHNLSKESLTKSVEASICTTQPNVIDGLVHFFRHIQGQSIRQW